MPVLRLWGASLALRIPKPLAIQLGLHEGSVVDLEVEAGRLVVAPRERAPGRLADMLKGLPPDTKVSDIDWPALMRRDEDEALRPPTVTRKGKSKGKLVRQDRMAAEGVRLSHVAVRNALKAGV